MARHCKRFNESQTNYEAVCTGQGGYDKAEQNTIAAFRSKQQPTIVQIYDAGTVMMLGQTVRTLDRAALKAFRSRVGFVFQKHNLVGRLSVLTNVVHGVQARMSGPRSWHHAFAPAAIREEAMACLAAVGLADRALQRADSLSGGQSQRVAIARMLMQRPEFVLADEPDASLDPRAGRELMELLYGLAHNKGLGLVVISHRIEHTLKFSDRIVGLAGGGVTLDLETRHAHAEQLRAFFDRPADFSDRGCVSNPERKSSSGRSSPPSG